MKTRRTFLSAMAAVATADYLAPMLLAATGFWNKKPSTDWSTDEIMQITSRSPWAHETNLDFESAEEAPAHVAGSGSPYAGQDGNGRGATIERPSGGARRAPVVVRWESARPIRDALLVPLPSAFANHYVLSVSNIPPAAMRPSLMDDTLRRPDDRPFTLEAMLDQLQAAATLQVVGKERAGAGVVRRAASSEATYLFGFAREFFPISSTDKEVIFTLRTARVSVRTRFILKDMVYHNGLAL